MPSDRKPLPPAPFGNRRGLKHGVYAKQLTPLEDAEVEQLANAVRELSPLDTDSLEPLVQIVGGQLWRLRRAYSDLNENGVIRGRKDRGRLAPTFAAALDLEKALLTGLRELGMTSRSAAQLGLDLRRLQEADRDRDFDPARLTIRERQQLEALLEKAEVQNARR